MEHPIPLAEDTPPADAEQRDFLEAPSRAEEVAALTEAILCGEIDDIERRMGELQERINGVRLRDALNPLRLLGGAAVPLRSEMWTLGDERRQKRGQLEEVRRRLSVLQAARHERARRSALKETERRRTVWMAEQQLKRARSG
jgi:hypothetical protein